VQLNAIYQKKKKLPLQETQPKETAITRQQTITDENSSTGNTGRNTSNTTLPTDLTQSSHIGKTSPTSPTFSGARLTDARNSTAPPIAHDLSQSNLEHADGFTHPPSWKLEAILDHNTTSVTHKYITS
jgi:hypothetical protein